MPNAGQSDPLGRGASCGRGFVSLLPNAGQSDALGGGAGCGRVHLPRHELHAGGISITYLSP